MRFKSIFVNFLCIILLIAVSFALYSGISKYKSTIATTSEKSISLSTSLEDDLEKYKTGDDVELNIGGFPGGLVTFIDDDGFIEVWDNLKPIFEKQKAPCCIAMTAGGLENVNYLSSTQLLTLQDMGWEILSHSLTHPRLTDLSNEEIESELKDSKDTLVSIGLNCSSLAYPYGDYNDNIISLTKKYYSSAVSIYPGTTGLNRIPLNTYTLYRVTLGGSESKKGTSQDTLEYYLSYVDLAKQTSSWLIFMTHAKDSEEYQLKQIDDVITYCKEKHIEIVTLDEALEKANDAQ